MSPSLNGSSLSKQKSKEKLMNKSDTNNSSTPISELDQATKDRMDKDWADFCESQNNYDSKKDKLNG